MKDDVMPMSENQSVIQHNIDHQLTAKLQHARLLIAELEAAVRTSNTLVHALLDGSANDKKIGKFILKTAKQTDALLDQQTCKQLYTLLERNILDANPSD